MEILKIIVCIQIFFFILGPGYETLALTFNGQLVAKFPRADALKAHVIQFGLLYLYGISYYGTSKKEKPPSYFFEFVTYYLWNIQPNAGSGSRKKRILTGSQTLWEKITTPERS